jgi:hypothetical protein
VELLIEAGRPWEAARAGRLVPHLEQLTGYGFVVDVAAVRKVNLDDDGGEEEEEEEEEEHRLLSAAVQAALRHCCTGEGEPPRALLLAAIACAGSGSVCGIPVEAMRADTLAELDLYDAWTGPEGAALIANLVPVMGGLTRVDVRHNNIVGDGASQLAAAVLRNLKIEMFNEIPIKEMRADSFTELGLKGKGVGVAGGMVVAGLIPVMGGLTKLSLAENELGEEGTKAICEALEQNKTLKELDISNSPHRGSGSNIGGSAGAKHVAKMLGVNGGLTKLSLAQNNLEEAGTKTICEALEQNTTLKELDISGHEYSNIGGSAGAKHVAKMVRVNGGLTKISLAKNMLGEEGTKAICEALEQNKTLKELDISGDGFGASNIGGSAGVKHVAKMLGVNGGLTSINMSGNNLTDSGRDMTGIKELAAALGVNGGLTSLNLSSNQLCGYVYGTYTAEGITAIADALRVNGALTEVR